MSSKGILGFLLGSAVGAAFGLLTTPRSGKENQLAVKEYIDGTTYQVKDVSEKVKDLQDSIQTLTTEGQALFNAFSKDMEQTANTFTHEAEPRIRRIEDHLNTLTKDMEDAANSISSTLTSETQNS